MVWGAAAVLGLEEGVLDSWGCSVLATSGGEGRSVKRRGWVEGGRRPGESQGGRERQCDSETETRDKRLAELKELLLSRDYPERLIDSALTREKAIPRRTAIQKVIRRKKTAEDQYLL